MSPTLKELLHSVAGKLEDADICAYFDRAQEEGLSRPEALRELLARRWVFAAIVEREPPHDRQVRMCLNFLLAEGEGEAREGALKLIDENTPRQEGWIVKAITVLSLDAEVRPPSEVAWGLVEVMALTNRD